MDCCVCSPTLSLFRPPRNSICASCYEGAKGMMGFLSKLDDGRHGDPNAAKGLSKAFKWVKEMEAVERGLVEKVEFLQGFAVALRETIDTDILVQPGAGGASIPAHRALLAARSEMLRTLLGSDDVCKAPAGGSVSLPELNHEELRCLLEFLYRGSLPEEDAERHAFALLLAADKYDVPFLRRFCEGRILAALTPANALDVLEVAEACASEALRRRAMNSVVEHAEDVVFSARYEAFARENAHLCVEITRMLLREKRGEEGCEGKIQSVR